MFKPENFDDRVQKQKYFLVKITDRGGISVSELITAKMIQKMSEMLKIRRKNIVKLCESVFLNEQVFYVSVEDAAALRIFELMRSTSDS